MVSSQDAADDGERSTANHGWPFFDRIQVKLRARTVPVSIAGNGSPLLLLHGYPLDSRMWGSVMRTLANRHLCIAPDLRGFGLAAEEKFSFSLRDLAGDCSELLDVLQVQQPIDILGLSMGGYTAMEFIDRYPNRIRKIVLSNTKASLDEDSALRVRYATAAKAIREGSRAAVAPMLERLTSRRTQHERPEVISNLESMMFETKPSTIAWAQLAMATRRSFTEIIRGWRYPTLCITGADDTITPADVLEQICRSIPEATLKVLPGSGHLPPLEQPTEFAGCVEPFLRHFG